MAHERHGPGSVKILSEESVMRVSAFVFSLVLLCSVPLSADQFRETTTVEVIEVPVYVTRDGEAIADLKRDNFALFVNEKPVAFEYFDVVDFASTGSERPVDLRRRRLYYLLFDLTSEQFAIGRAQRAMDEFIAEAREGDLFAVGTLGATRGVRTVVPFTSDRTALRTAIRGLENRTRDPLRMAVTLDAPPDFGSQQFGSVDFTEMEEIAGDLVRQQRSRQIQGMLGALDDLARQFAALEGQKHVVLLSTGFDAELVDGIHRRRRPLANWTQGPIAGRDLILSTMRLGESTAWPSSLPQPNGTMMKALERLNTRYAAASVFLHAVDTAGVRATLNLADNESLHMLARSGEVIANRNDLREAMTDLTGMHRFVYVLGFRRRPTGRSENRITVLLRDVPRGVEASYRRSYSTAASPAPSSDQLSLADIVLNDIPQSGISVKLNVQPLAEGTALDVEVSGRELLAFGGQVTAEVLFYVFSESRAAGFAGKHVSIDSQRATGLEAQPLRVRQIFNLPAGSHVARVLVRVNGGVLGFARQEFSVGEVGAPSERDR